MARRGTVVSHWHTLVDHFNTSTLDFYEAVKDAVRSREVPDVGFSRVEFKEGGLASAKREYLRIVRGNVAFDICGAPYGNGFFFSWWVSRLGPPVLIVLLIFFVLVAIGWIVLWFLFNLATQLVFDDGVVLLMLYMVSPPVTLIPVLFGLGILARKGFFGPEENILAIPVLGWIYEIVFSPITYYSLDTALMFQESMGRAVNEVISGLLDEKGIRSLSAEEQKPTIRDLAA